jgi:hypothetical protein
MRKSNFISSINEDISNSSFKDAEVYLFAFCVFLLSSPYFVWNLFSPLLLVSICSVLSIKNIKINSPVNNIFFIVFVFFYFYIAYKDNSNLFGILHLMGICTILLTSEEFLKKVLTNYIFIFSITLVPSIFIFLIVYVFGVDLPHSYIEPLNTAKWYNYIHYPFLVQPNQVLEQFLPRFSGYYDEAGVVGTIAGVILLSSGFNLKKKINIPIFIAGLLSFSFAFYVMALVYGFIFIRSKYKILIAIAIFGIIFLFSKNELLDSYVFSRFQYENGQIAGDNREADEDFKGWYDKFSKSSDYYFGLGENSSQIYNSGGASYKNMIVDYGIISISTICFALIAFSFSKFVFKKEFFIYLFIIFSVLYQRPFITMYFYMFLIFSPLVFLSKPQEYSELI